MGRILVIDDESNIITVMSDILQDEGHTVFSAPNGKSGLAFLSKNEVDLVFLDVWLPDMDGLEIIEKIRSSDEDTPVIMISGHASIDIAVKSTKLGAYDFIEKPLSLEKVVTLAANAVEHVTLKRENRRLKFETAGEDAMIGDSPAMHEVKSIIAKAAGTNARVFITGGNGTGKELVARAIYTLSRRADKPFIKVNCAAIPDELIESELFGHEKGSFTGAVARRAGKFEQANGGTIFLDEICDMSASAQAKVLRVLQEQQFERVGGNETITVDVRVIAATNIDVRSAVEEGRFREDLYFRLNVIPIVVPSLSERRDDIPLLVGYYLNRFCSEHGIPEKTVTEKGLDYLRGYAWPGNVRELKNLMERISIMAPSEEIGPDDIRDCLDADGPQFVPEKSALKDAKESFEKQHIVRALRESGGNISAAAKSLGVERTNLHRKIKQYNIDMDKLG
jgi:two-component system nitrogen regulation response regulator NtrX